jgi:LuxR family maltose regulon positive regulatory protein
VRHRLARAALLLGESATARTLLSEAEHAAEATEDVPVLRTLLDDARRRLRALQANTGAAASPLTNAELRTVRYLNSYLTLPEIAERLCVSPNTVKTHVRAIYGKLGVSSRSQAIEAATQQGLVESGVAPGQSSL